MYSIISSPRLFTFRLDNGHDRNERGTALRGKMKRCKRCGDLKDAGEFLRQSKARDGLGIYCRSCRNEYQKKWMKRNKDKSPEGVRRYTRDMNLRANYGITLGEYERRYKLQGGKCAICHKHFDKLHVDHAHNDGVVRGLLCPNCNVMIGHALEDIAILQGAIEYLSKEHLCEEKRMIQDTFYIGLNRNYNE